MTRQIAIGFVAYNPGADFLRRTQIAAEAGFDVFIFDNSPQNVSSRKIVARFPRIKCFTSGKNLGLGMGISFVCAEAYFEDHKALLFFDQDTVFSERTLSFIERRKAAPCDLQNKPRHIQKRCPYPVPDSSRK